MPDGVPRIGTASGSAATKAATSDHTIVLGDYRPQCVACDLANMPRRPNIAIMPNAIREASLCYQTPSPHGGSTAPDEAMRVLKPGSVYMLLPGGGGGTLSKHTTPGFKQ